MMIRRAEQALEVARYYQHKNMSLQPGSLVWLHKRATNQLDGDLMIARKLALQWSGPFIYLRTINDCLGEISRQDKGVQTGKLMRVHLSKLCLYRDPEAYPGQHAELFKPGKMGALDDGSTENSEEEDQLLQLPIVELTPEAAAQAPADHFYRIPEAALDIPDEIDRSQPEVPAPVKVQDWLEGQAVIENASREGAQPTGAQGPGASRREAFWNEPHRAQEAGAREERQHASREIKPAGPTDRAPGADRREAFPDANRVPRDGAREEAGHAPRQIKPAGPRWQPVRDEMMSFEEPPPILPVIHADGEGWQTVKTKKKKKERRQPSPIPPLPSPA